jgi:hypothetical protein
MGVPSTLHLDFSSESAIAAYDLYTNHENGDKDPTAWSVYCKMVGAAAWSLMETRSVTPPSSRKTSYGVSGGLSGNAFSWASVYPTMGPMLAVGSALSSCKFVFSATVGTGVGENLKLAEVRLFDMYGDRANVMTDSGTTNPGGKTGANSYSVSKVLDLNRGSSWRDEMGVPSTLQLDFSSNPVITSYQLYTNHENGDQDPTAWKVYCKTPGADAWSENGRVVLVGFESMRS